MNILFLMIRNAVWQMEFITQFFKTSGDPSYYNSSVALVFETSEVQYLYFKDYFLSIPLSVK